VERVSDVVAPYGLERATVDGNDAIAVWTAFRGYLESARAGGGPYLLECLTHRLRGHYEGDPGAYREALAAAEWQELDPIQRLQRDGAARGWFAESAVQAIEADAAEALEEAVRFARGSSFPSEALIEELVYARA
jgi:pyruvate dehydrogenase E1 component alpha subunit